VISYLLDTNVVSELSKARSNRKVERRTRETQREAALAAPTLDELVYGVSRLPAGAQREMLERWLEELLGVYPVIPFDEFCARWHGRERARLRVIGRTHQYVDGQIAAIAVVNELILVTRNISGFAAFEGIKLEDWFE
jgi:tRNA(fMet)-specific endonuclease VapC